MEKRVGAIIIVIIIISVTIYLLFGQPTTDNDDMNDSDGDGYPDDIDPFPDNPDEWIDNDGDGWGNNTDIYDYGNIGIVVYVSHYEAEAQVDENSAFPDPWFKIFVGYETGNWTYETESTEEYPNIQSWDDCISFIVDIPDNHTDDIYVLIELWDLDDFTSDEEIDYRGADSEFWTIHNYNLLDNETIVSDSGYDDGIGGETNCNLDYGIMTGIIE